MHGVAAHRGGDASLKSLLGGKGANLAEMSRRGFRMPDGFTITADVCTYYPQKTHFPTRRMSEVTRPFRSCVAYARRCGPARAAIN